MGTGLRGREHSPRCWVRQPLSSPRRLAAAGEDFGSRGWVGRSQRLVYGPGPVEATVTESELRTRNAPSSARPSRPSAQFPFSATVVLFVLSGATGLVDQLC